jgi:hypothetical protein
MDKTIGAPNSGEDANEPHSESRVTRRRNRMAGLWAAELLGLLGQAAQDYAHDLVRAHDHAPGDDGVIHRLAADLKGKASTHDIRAKLSHLLHEARRQLLAEDHHHPPQH